MLPLSILYEDNHLLAVNKPAGWPSTHYDGVTETIDRLAKAYLKEKYQKPGNVFLGVVHRLDKPTSGVLLFARTSKAAARLSEQFREATVTKVYWAVTAAEPGKPPLHDAGSFTDGLWEDDTRGTVTLVAANTAGAKTAVTGYRVLARHDRLTWLELRPRTGRRHQLRVQLASRGHPIIGDEKYGSRLPFGNAVALHARSLTFQHPTREEAIALTAPLPGQWIEQFGTWLREPSS